MEQQRIKVGTAIPVEMHARLKEAAAERKTTIGSILEFAATRGLELLERRPRLWKEVQPDRRAGDISRKFNPQS